MDDEKGESRRRRRRERRAKLLLFVGSVLFTLAIIEIGLRVAGYSYPEFFVADARRGYVFRAGMEGWDRKEGAAYVRINSDGLRDREHTKAKPPHTFRVAVLGDSYMAALQVPAEDTFCAQLERELRDCPNLNGRAIEVINFGVPGYGTSQELITLREQVWQYSPDIVVLAVTTSNDVSDNERALRKTDTIPYFVWRDGRLIEDDSFLQARTFQAQQTPLYRLWIWLLDHSRIIQGISDVSRSVKIRLAERRARLSREQESRKTAPGGLPGAAPSTAGEELGVENQVYREPNDPVWNDAWNVTERLMATMRDEVQGKGASLFVVTLSSGIQVWPDPVVRENFLKRVGAKDIFYPDNRIREFCQREGIAVMNLAPTMQHYADDHKVFLHGFGKDIGNGHWNAVGHRIAAELAAPEVCKLVPKQ
jgi:hypothetical protein